VSCGVVVFPLSLSPLAGIGRYLLSECCYVVWCGVVLFPLSLSSTTA